ncbi:hypothetical protein Tco_0895650, partial [Tanacetum coccineum]
VERRDEKEEIGSLKTRSNNVSDQDILLRERRVAGKIRGEVRYDGLVASIARWRLMSRRFDRCCSSFRLLVIWFRVGFYGGEGGDKELVVMGEVGGVLLGGGDGGEGGRL